MTNFLMLTKTFFLSGFGINKKNNKRSINSLLSFGLIFLFVSLFYNFTMFMGVKSGEIKVDSYIFSILALTTFLTLILSVTQMESSIFKTKDYEFLESLPIKRSTVVGAKIASVYVFNLFEDAIFLLPTVVCTFILTGNLYLTILLFTLIFFISLIPLLISSLLGLLLVLIKNRFKNNSFVSIALYILLFALIFGFSFSVSNEQSMDPNMICKLIPYLTLFYQAFDIQKLYLYLIFLVICVFSFILTSLIISLFYQRINTTDFKVITNKNTHNETIKNPILKKELKSLTSNATYFVNSFIGPIVSVIMCIFMLFLPTIDVSILEGSPIENYNQIMCLIIPGMCIVMNTMNSSTNASLSLEQKNFETLLSYPLTYDEILQPKINAALLVLGLLNIVCSTILNVILIIVNGFNIFIFLAVYLYPLLGTIFVTYIGMICGIRWANFDFTNIMQVVKQGPNIGFSMLFSALPAGIVSIANIILSFILPPYLTFIITLLLLVIMCLIAFSIYNKKKDKLMARLINN